MRLTVKKLEVKFTFSYHLWARKANGKVMTEWTQPISKNFVPQKCKPFCASSNLPISILLERFRRRGRRGGVGNIPYGYNCTCPLPRLLVRQQAQVPVGQQVRQSGTFPTGRAQTALTLVHYQPSYLIPLLS